MPWLATLMLGSLLGLFPAFADEARSVPKSNLKAVNSARIKAESLNGGLTDKGGAECMNAPLNSAVANASKARPEIPCSSTKVAGLDGRKAVSLQAWKLKSGFRRTAALILK